MRMDRIAPVDAGTLLVRALRASSTLHGCAISVESVATRPWSSATFVGAWVSLTIDAVPSAALAGWLASLPEAEWALRGHLVADLDVVPDPTPERPNRTIIEVLAIGGE